LQTRALVILIYILIYTNAGIAQNRVNKYPVQLCQYYDSYALLNPAFMGSLANIELTAGYHNLLGNFNKVSTYYFNSGIRLGHSNNKGPFSVVGIRLFNDREGKYLNRTRGYVVYSWHATLTGNLKFSAGLELGGMSYLVKGTPLSGNGSDLKSDASAGVSIYNKSFSLGLSMAQLFKSEVQPIEEITVLHPYINITSEGRFHIMENTILMPSSSIRIITNDNKISVGANLGILIRNKLFVSPGFYANYKIVIGLGIKDLLLLNGKMNILISYGFPAIRSSLNYSFCEIGVGYLL